MTSDKDTLAIGRIALQQARLTDYQLKQARAVEPEPTEPMASPMPLDDDECEPTVLTGIPVLPIDDDPQCMTVELACKRRGVLMNLANLPWIFQRNDGNVEISTALHEGKWYRRKLELQTGRAFYSRADRFDAPDSAAIAVSECGTPIVAFMPEVKSC